MSVNCNQYCIKVFMHTVLYYICKYIQCFANVAGGCGKNAVRMLSKILAATLYHSGTTAPNIQPMSLGTVFGVEKNKESWR